MLQPRTLLIFLFLLNGAAWAQQGFWSEFPADRASALPGERRIAPRAFRALALDVPALRAHLQQVPAGELNQVVAATSFIALPTPEGGFSTFRILEVPVMHPELQARFPEIRTYTGTGLEDGATLKMDLTPHGFHAMVLVPGGEDWFIDPLVHGDAAHCQSYLRRDFSKALPADHRFCRYDEVNDLEAAEQQTLQWIGQMESGRVVDCQLRRYRLALACTGEYANYHGSNTTNNNKSFAAAAMATSLNRVNGMFERDANLTMQLVANNDLLIYLNGTTDPYTNNDGGAMLDQNTNNCNAVIGTANYDIGHVFSTGGGGVAYLNSPCTSFKGGGVTGSSAPVGDPFDIDYVAHEMGHQFGGNHSQNNNCQRASAAAVEVGSGITIMGYAGICAPNVASNSIAMFGGYSMQEIAANITTGNSSTCPVVIPTGNQQPTATAGPNYTIPRSTPFILSGSGSDPDPGTVLTYSWEQMNNTVAPQPPQATNTGGPAWVPLLPQSTPVRYMPNLPAVVANTTPTWEVLSSVARTYNFRLTVRDNRTGGGCARQSNMTVTVNGTAGPFAVTAPNTAVSWQAFSTQTVTWNVAGTTAAPVSCANVDILLSTDGGLNYPIVLATATPNDGSEAITVPDNPTTTARIMVRGNGNIFYDISNANFTITPGAALSPRLALEGAYDPATGLMRDQLRTLPGFPLTEPFTSLGYAHVGSGGEATTPAVLAVTGANAIVDWVVVELRSSASPGTVVATRSALLQRDGDVVGTDGTSPVRFAAGAGNYHVAIRHRNHLAVMTAGPVAVSGTPATVDFRSAALATFGTEARKSVTGVFPAQVLWAGDASFNNNLMYVGEGNDRDPILLRIGGSVPTNTVSGYFPEDVNIDGVVKYVGEDNDRDPILFNIGGSVPTNTRPGQLP